MKIKAPTIKKFDRPFSADVEGEFRGFLANHGFEVVGNRQLISDGKIGRAYITNDKQGKQNGWYQLWLDQTIPYGRIGDYRISATDPTATFRPENAEKWEEVSPEMKRQIKEEAKEKEVVRKAEQKAHYQKGADRAIHDWESGVVCDSHPYLEKKQVQSHGLKTDKDGALLIPIRDVRGGIAGLQRIDASGNKKIQYGSKKESNFFVIGQLKKNSAPVINYVEGYATGASYFEDHNQPVVVCFDAYNLSNVAKVLFEFFKESKHVFIADNDEKSKTGEKEAVKACQAIQELRGQAEVLMPMSAGDYNDHANDKNKDVVEVLEGELLDPEEPKPVVMGDITPVDYEFTKSATGKYLNVKENIQGVLTVNSINVVYNVIKKVMEIDIPNMNFIEDLKEDASLTEIENRCITMGVPHSKVADYLKVICKPYNPVKEWMESKRWDGRSRLQEFLDTIGCPDNEPLKEMLMRKWLISCVAAACEPKGVELEGILVFQGAQGLGKTLWFKRLANYESGWLLEGATLNPSDKDSVKRAVSHWIVELGEIESTFKKSDIDQLKAFVTARSDELRLPYDRGFSRYQRRTAFYASVNAREFLTDTSGNRRFWVIPVRSINFDHGIDMQQLWAEVKETLYVEGKKNWFLSPDEREMLHESNEVYRTQSAVEDLILEHVRFGSKVTEPVQMTKLLKDLGVSNPRMPDFKDAARILSEKGLEPRRSNGKKVYDIDYDTPDQGSDKEFSSFDGGNFKNNY